MEHTHHHQHNTGDVRNYMPIYLRAWGVTFIIAGLELVGSILSGSLALLADITHVFTDTIVGMGPISVEFFRHRINVSAHKIEQTGGILVSFILIFVGYHVIGEALEHLSGDKDHHVEGAIMFAFSALAAAANYIQHRLLSRVSPMHRHAAHTGFHFHVMTDLVKNIILPLIAVVIMFGGPEGLDIWAGIAIGTLVIVRGLILALESTLGKNLVQARIDSVLHWLAR